MNPYDRILRISDELQDRVCKFLIYIAIMAPPGCFIAKTAGHVMEQRPEAGVGKSLIMCLGLLLREENGHASVLLAERLLKLTTLRFIIDPHRPADQVRSNCFGSSPSNAATSPPDDLVMVPSSLTVTGRRLETLIRVVADICSWKMH